MLDDDADGGLGAVLKAELRGVGADRQSGQIGLVDADAVLVGENVVIRALTQVLAADGDAGQVVLVRIEQKFVGKGDVVLVVDVDGQGRRGDGNARRGGGGLARDGGGDAAGELYLSRLHDKLAAARVQLCGLHRAVAGDGGLCIRGQFTDERAAGGDDGGSGFGVQDPRPKRRSERLAPSPVTVTSEKPPAFAERPLSESKAEDCTSAVPILVEPVAITVGLMPIGLETIRFIAVTPSSVTLPPPTMISPLTVTLFRLTLPESTPSVM